MVANKLKSLPFINLAKKLKTPKQVQNYLRSLPYNRELKGETVRSAAQAIKLGTAHCFEATFVAAAILEHQGYPPLVVSFQSADQLDHVLYVFKEKGKWGSVARSRDEGLHGRPPVYRSIRDLVWSYYDPYIDKSGKIIGYQLASLDDTNTDWRYSTKNVWKAEKYLVELEHKKLKSSTKRYNKTKAKYLKFGPPNKGKNWW